MIVEFGRYERANESKELAIANASMRANFPEELTTNFASLLVPLWRS